MQTDQLTLRTILTRKDHQDVKILRSAGERVRRVTAREALLMAHASEYLWDGTATRIKSMRERFPKYFEPCWRNQEAAVLPPGIDYFRNVV
jgi:hypothetical protein